MFHFENKPIYTSILEEKVKNHTKDGQLYFEKVNGQSIVFCREGDKINAFKNRCPHQGQSLQGGWCKKGKIVCPVHRYAFDLETGRGHGDAMFKYDVTIEEGKVVLWREKFVLF